MNIDQKKKKKKDISYKNTRETAVCMLKLLLTEIKISKLET